MTESRKERLAIELSRYIFAIHGPSNAWGKITVNDMQSHVYLHLLHKRYGKARIERYLDSYFGTTLWCEKVIK